MNRHKKPASKVTAKLTGTSQSMTTIQSHHSVNNNTASNAGTDPAMSSVASQQQDAVIDLYNLLTDGSMIFADETSDIQAMTHFTALFEHLAGSPAAVKEFNRRWLPTFNAAKHVAELMEQNRISVIHFGGGK